MADFLKTWVLLLRPLFSPRFLLALAASVRTLYLESVSLCVCVSLSLSLSLSLFKPAKRPANGRTGVSVSMTRLGRVDLTFNHLVEVESGPKFKTV